MSDDEDEKPRRAVKPAAEVKINDGMDVIQKRARDVDGFLARNYPGREAEMFAKLAATQPIGRMGRPEEVADLALFLCSDEASFITGSDYPLDGGFIRLNS